MQEYREIFKLIVESHKNHTKWDTGDFVGIKSISNTKVGTVGQDFIENLCTLLNIPFNYPLNKVNIRANQSPWDIEINNVKFELKTATEDTNSHFQFNHLRYHREYQAVLCLGVSPDDLFFNVWSKADIVTGKAGRLVSMEKNANASYKLTKSKNGLLHIEHFHEKIIDFTSNFE